MGNGSRTPTVDQLRKDIDRGQAGDKVAGVDPAAAPLGTDSEVTPGSYPQVVVKRLGRDYPEAAAPLRAAHPDVRKTVGFESMESLEDLSNRLQDRGWTEADLRKLLGENLMRVYGQNWEVSA